MQGEKAERGNALGEKEGSEKGASGQAGCGPPLSLFPFPSVCVSLLAALAAASGQLA